MTRFPDTVTLNDEQIAQVRLSLAEGRGFFDIAKDLCPGRGFSIAHLNTVIDIAQFEPAYDARFMGEYIYTEDRTIKIAYKHPCPQIVLLDNVLSDEECAAIIEMARPKLKRSKVHEGGDSKTLKIHDHRRSDTHFLKRGSNAFVQRIDQRCSQIMNSSVLNGESLQVVRYKVGGEYKAHYDYQVEGDETNNRVATLLMYLNDVPAGGKTFFPGLKLAVTPKKGSAIYFGYADAQRRPGRFDPQTLHGGEPVLAGEKWIVTKWARELPYSVKFPKS